MPLLAALIGGIATGLVSVLGRMMALDLALKFASYIAWISVLTAFLGTVFVCATSLNAAVRAAITGAGGINGGMLSAFAMGLTMLIPANAGGVLACVASVWIASSIYKIQKHGISNFSK